jgi:RimJ/RimL family protein N-acetyltransferase
MVLLETARLRLRQFTAADLGCLVELDSDPEVMRYITYGEPTPREEYLEEILPRWLRIYRETPLLGYWAAEDRGSGAFHGGSRAVMEKCGLRYERDFIFPQDALEGRSAEERAAVKYSITRSQWQSART